MARFTVTFRGMSGPGAGGKYTYYTRADSPDEAVEKAGAQASRPHHRLNRGNTVLDPKPIDIRRTN